MYLTKEDEKMLSGEHGVLVQEAMRFLVRLGDAYRAERMIDIDYSYASVSMDSPLSFDLLREAARSGLRVKTPTVNWNYGLEVNHRAQVEVSISRKNFTKVRKTANVCKELGMIPVNTCAPYLVDTMDRSYFGSHISSLESSAITYYNTVLGVRTNRDSLSALTSAITGRYPEFGFHLNENRAGRYLFEVKTSLSNSTDYSLLGYYIGEISGAEVPVILGIRNPRVEELKAICCSMSVGGSVTLAHIVGVTPEARTLEVACQRTEIEDKISVTGEELKATHEKLADQGGEVNFVILGCPHYTIHQIGRVASLLGGKQVKEGVKVWIMTAPSIYTIARRAGLADAIEKSGAIILATCPLVSPGIPGPKHTHSHLNYSAGNIATDSTKMAYYAYSNLRSKRVFLGSTEKCIEAAASGKWGL